MLFVQTKTVAGFKSHRNLPADTGSDRIRPAGATLFPVSRNLPECGNVVESYALHQCHASRAKGFIHAPRDRMAQLFRCRRCILVQHFGFGVSFLGLAAAGLAGVALVSFGVPETLSHQPDAVAQLARRDERSHRRAEPRPASTARIAQ